MIYIYIYITAQTTTDKIPEEVKDKQVIDKSGYIGQLQKFRPQWNFPENMQLCVIKGDGHCLFRAISMIVNGTQEKWKIYRKLAITQIQNNRSKYAPLVHLEETSNYGNKEYKFLAQHLQALDNFNDEVEFTSWGGQIDIFAIADYLQCRVIVYKGTSRNYKLFYLFIYLFFRVSNTYKILLQKFS